MFQYINFASLILFIIPGLLAITVHEAAHAYAAKRCGDNTALMMGRLTLNPLKHIDPIGTIALPLITFLLTSLPFGWAKPVPIQPRNFHNIRTDTRIVSLAGPFSNLLMAVIWAVVMAVSIGLPGSVSTPLIGMAMYGVTFNISLFIINMIPILPLDGGRAVDTLLSPKASQQFGKIEPYGIWILLGLIATGIWWHVMSPIYVFFDTVAHWGVSALTSLLYR